MKTRILTGWLTSVAICALSFGSMAGFAQEDSATTTNTTITVSESTGSRSDDANHDVEPEKKKGVRHEAIVVFGEDVELKAGDTAKSVVVIGGSAKIRGSCDECVVIGGG